MINRVQSEDGGWRTLDSRGMFRATVGLSEMYTRVLSDFLTQALGCTAVVGGVSTGVEWPSATIVQVPAALALSDRADAGSDTLDTDPFGAVALSDSPTGGPDSWIAPVPAVLFSDRSAVLSGGADTGWTSSTATRLVPRSCPKT